MTSLSDIGFGIAVVIRRGKTPCRDSQNKIALACPATENAKLRCLPLAQFKEELVDLVRNFGGVRAAQSRLLHGITSEMMVTFGSSVTMDAAGVKRFRLALIKSGQSRLLKRVFRKDERWTMMPQAATIIKGEKLSTALLSLYSQCQVVKPKTPSLVVRKK